ncbi:uncharacterized protein BXZ73DRAFT_109738 [Epithele typhae]|uniref:uncharacterized protein n=1 Tax=Epithele typhae TaxID=378194 RepID=UPI0020074354|nr:uncharacterized protein BXZ73DRAFT_109738 [Epithele typhae]KAH9908833.1 hypothetical protein BXZ73DRAFT_109738 [Epithele typhae]
MTGEQAAAMSDLSSQLHYAWYYYQATLMNADSQKTYDLELRSLIIRLNRQYAHWGGANLKSLPSLALAAIYENDRVIKILRRKLRPGQYLNEAQVRDNILVAHLIPIKDGSLPGQFEGASRIAQTPDDGGCNFKLSSVPQMYKRPAGLQRINRRSLSCQGEMFIDPLRWRTEDCKTF